jgi:hypothetical protein
VALFLSTSPDLKGMIPTAETNEPKGDYPMNKIVAAALAVAAVALTSPAFAATADLMTAYYLGR